MSEPTNPNSFLCKLGIHEWGPWSDGKNIQMIRMFPATGNQLEYMAILTIRRCNRCNKYQERTT